MKSVRARAEERRGNEMGIISSKKTNPKGEQISALAYAWCPDHIGSTSKICDYSATPTICVKRTKNNSEKIVRMTRLDISSMNLPITNSSHHICTLIQEKYVFNVLIRPTDNFQSQAHDDATFRSTPLDCNAAHAGTDLNKTRESSGNVSLDV